MMTMELDGLEVLSEAECRRLLGHERLGRVAVSVGALPAVFPVNYALVGDEICFFTAEGTKLRAATSNAIIAFETDHVDPFAETGWSVLVVGLAREQAEPVVVAGAMASGLRPWAPGDRPHLVGLTTEFVSGRRIPGGVARGPHGHDTGVAVGRYSSVLLLAGPPVRVSLESTLQEAADAMREANVSSVLVGADGAIATERDLAHALSAGLGPATAVASVSTTDLVSVSDAATVLEAAGDMLRHEIRHLLVRNHRGEVVGVVSLRALMGVLLDALDPAVWVALRHALSARIELSGQRLAY